MARTHTESRRMHTLRDTFFAGGAALDAAGDAEANCWICKQPIDYSVGANTTADSHHLDHLHPVTVRPDLAEDPSNFRHAHKRCNERRGNRAPTLGLGQQVTDWW